MSGTSDRLDRGLDHASKQESQLAGKKRLLSVSAPDQKYAGSPPTLWSSSWTCKLLFMDGLSLGSYVTSDCDQEQPATILTSFRFQVMHSTFKIC
jgi:hypothetical protein